MPHDIFVSHSSTDASVAQAACEALEESGLRCWIAPRDIAPGKTWSGAIVEGIEGGRVLLVVLSRHANESLEVVREVEHASRQKKHLLALRVENVGPTGALGYFLSANQWLDAFPQPLQPRLAALVRAVRSLLEIEEPPPQPATPEPEFVEVDLDDFGRSPRSKVVRIDRLFEDR
jgi:hypothetical protein